MLAKHIVRTVRNLEESCRQQKTASYNLRMDTLKKENHSFEKFAVRLNLRKSLSSSEHLLKHQKNLSDLEKDNLQRGLEQLKIVL